jgi:hypothetical protein
MLQLTGILDGSNTSAEVGTRYRPAGLSDPDPLARRDTVNRVFRILYALPKDVGGIADRRSLEVRIAKEDVSQKSLGCDVSRELTRPCR